MDITSLKAVLADLRPRLLPSRFEISQQPDPNTLQLGFRTLEGLTWLELSWNAVAPRLVEIIRPPRNGTESTLAKQIQYGLNQLALIEIKQKNFERIIEFGFSFRPGERIHKVLILELMGRHSNLFLTDKQQKVVAIGRQVRSKQSRVRPISTGDFYIPPPSLTGVKPSSNEVFSEWKRRLSLIPVNLKKALQDNYQGISPSLAIQLVNEAKENTEKILNCNVNQLNENDWIKIHKRWLIWIKAIEREDLHIYYNGPTHFRCWCEGVNFKKQKEGNALTLGNYYNNKLKKKRIKETQSIIEKKIMRIRENEEKYLNMQKNLFRKISDYKKIQSNADSLLALVSPTKEQIEEAQKLYKTAKKLRRSESTIKERITYHSQRITSLEESESFLNEFLINNFEDANEILNGLFDLLNELDYYLANRTNQRQAKTSKKAQPLQPLELRSPSGLVIQIGRNHRQNELISLKKARKGDLWFHAQECPGSHVVLKSSNGLSEEADIQNAADFAAFFSRAKGNKTVAVIKVSTEHLQRIQGAIPGTVRYTRSEIIWGVPSRAMQHIHKNQTAMPYHSTQRKLVND